MATSRRARIVALALLAVATLATLVMLAGVLVPGLRPRPGVVPLFDDVAQPIGYAAAAAAAVVIAVRARSDRLLWWFVAWAMVLRAYGFVHTIYVLDRAPVYPSLADVAWIASSTLLVAALVTAGRRTTQPHGIGVLGLDALVAGLTATAVVTTLIDDTVDTLVAGGLPADVVATNLVYPLLDVACFAVLAGLLTLQRWRLGLDTWTLSVGIAAFAVVDLCFLYLVSTGQFRPGSLLAPLSLAGTAAIAGAGLVPSRRPAAATRRPSVVPPVVCALVCVLVLAYDTVGAVSQLGNVTAATAIIVSIARAFVTLTGDRRVSDETIAEKDEELLRFRALVNASSDYIGIGTLSGQVLYLNPSARRMTGLALDAPLDGFTISHALTDEAARRATDVERAEIMATGSWRGESELRSQTGDGPPVPVYKNTFLIRDDAGEPWLLGTIQRDITDLREAQVDIERFSSLVEASSDFVAIAAVDGTVLYVNPAGRELVGLAADRDVTTTTITDYLTEEGIRASLEVEQPAVVAHGHWEGESTLRDMRGGPPTPVAISSFLMSHPLTGEPWLLATVQRDISERIAAQRAVQDLADQRQLLLGHLVQAQEDERARIAADVHDDSVQALAAVELRLSLLQRELATAAPDLLPTVESLRGTVRGATDRLRHLLFDLESPAQQTDLRSALAEAAGYVLEDLVQWRIEGNGGRETPTASRVTAYRVAKEALTNVRKHAGAHRVVIGLRDRDGGVEVSVSDDGAGFDPGATAERPGHLGLPGMRDRVAVAGGTLEVASRPGEGTTVTLWLPRPGEGDVGAGDGDQDATRA